MFALKEFFVVFSLSLCSVELNLFCYIHTRQKDGKVPKASNQGSVDILL